MGGERASEVVVQEAFQGGNEIGTDVILVVAMLIAHPRICFCSVGWPRVREKRVPPDLVSGGGQFVAGDLSPINILFLLCYSISDFMKS